MSEAVNPIAGTGFARGAGVYATSRPGYPTEATEWLRDRLGIVTGSVVAEVGAGPLARVCFQKGQRAGAPALRLDALQKPQLDNTAQPSTVKGKNALRPSAEEMVVSVSSH